MMLICEGDVTNFERLRTCSAETYLNLLETKVRQMEAAQPKKKIPDFNKK